MRNVFESIRVALDMLRMYKLRAFLTMLGVIIGVMSVTIIVMARNGFTYYLTNEIEKLGARTIIIAFDPGRRNRGQSMGRIGSLTNDDVQYLRDRVQSIEIFSPIIQLPQQKVVYGSEKIDDPRIIATDENQSKLSSVDLLAGRQLSRPDMDSKANVCLIGEEIRDRLFMGEDPIGKYVSFGVISLEVIGVMKKIELLGRDSGKDVWLPLTTAQAKWTGSDGISFINALPYDDVEVEHAMDEIWEVLLLKSDNRPIYMVDSRESIIAVFGGIVTAAGVILAAIAALSLLVGGIGIMNIMLVSVTERTREIGLRKAVGARKMAIMTQFLVESAMLSLVGGLIGMGLAYGIGVIVTAVSRAKEWPTSEGLLTPFPIQAALFACAFSALIGVVFGIYPASKASKLSPIEALRSE